MKYFSKASVWLSVILIVDYGISSAEDVERNDNVTKSAGWVIARTVLDVASDYVPFVGTAVKLMDGFSAIKGLEQPDPSIGINKKIDDLAVQVQKISQNIKFFHDDIATSIDELGDRNEADKKNIEVYKLIREVEAEYTILKTTLSYKYYQQSDINGVIESVLGGHKMFLRLEQIVNSVVDHRDTGSNIIDLIIKPNMRNSQICKRAASIQQILYDHFQHVHGALILGLMLIIFSNQKNTSLHKIEKESAIHIALGHHFMLVYQLTNAFAPYINSADRVMWMCDPKNMKEGVTYERFGRAFQKYLINIKNVLPFPYTWDGMCENLQCKNIQKDLVITVHYDSQWAITYDSMRPEQAQKDKSIRLYRDSNKETNDHYLHDDFKNRCAGGTLTNCQTIKDSKLTVCPAREKAIERYAYIKGNGKESWTYGSEASCPKGDNSTRKIDNKDIGCSYCMCTCEHGVGDDIKYKEGYQLKSVAKNVTDRYIDLHPVDADEGHVVTGIRLAKNSTTHTFHLQIKQAKLLPMGQVSDPHWKNITTYYPFELEHDGYSNEKKYKEGVDYHAVRYNNTVIYLDDVPLKNNLKLSEANELHPVVVGVKFRRYDNDDEGGKIHLGLATKISFFNFNSGQMFDLQGYEPNSDDVKSIRDRNRVNIDDHDVPTKFNGKHKDITERSSYVELVNSGLKYDVGQNVLPFLDIQDVVTEPPMPLAAVGLYHRGCPDSGGYLGIKAAAVNFKYYLPDADSAQDTSLKILNGQNLVNETGFPTDHSKKYLEILQKLKTFAQQNERKLKSIV